MSQPHPNDLMEFASYPDPVRRQTYPPLPRKPGLNPNAVAPDALLHMAGNVGKRLPGTIVQDLAKVNETMVIPAELATTPEVEQLKAAGWV